jgi:hypothetical protein
MGKQCAISGKVTSSAHALQRTRSPEPTNLTEASRYRATVARTNGVGIPEQIVAAFVRGILRAGGDTHGPRKGILITPAQSAHT